MVGSRRGRRPRPAARRAGLTLALWLGGLIVAAAPGALAAQPARSDREGCLAGPAEAAVAACRRVLEQRPGDVDARLAMSDSLTRLGRYQDAVDLLRQGLELAPADGRIQGKLRVAESYLQEKRLIDARGDSPAQAAKPEVTLQLERVRCTSLTGDAALKACEKALQLAPQDASLHRAKGDALLAADRIGQAILAYREALGFDPAHQAAAQGLERAQARQKRYWSECRATSGEPALKACDQARVAGGPDEPAIQLRRGELLLELGRQAEAEQALQAALKLDPANAQASAKLAALRKPKEPVPQVAAAPDPKPASTAPAAAQPARPVQPPPKADSPPRRYSNAPSAAGVTY
jgi:tetratricopeptide (TPR) repeat protein